MLIAKQIDYLRYEKFRLSEFNLGFNVIPSLD